jgi:plasmid stability protein
MPNIQIKDVPDETPAVLRQRANAAHQSLQEYLRSKLIQEAAQPTLEEVLDRAGGRAGGSLPLAVAVSAVRFDRARH